MAARRLFAMVLVACVALDNLLLIVNGETLVDFNIDEETGEGHSLRRLRANRSKRSGVTVQPECGGCTRKWARQRACFSYNTEIVNIRCLCKNPHRKTCWTKKTVRHLVQRCCDGYHADGIYCDIDCGGCYTPRSTWEYPCAKKATYYRTQKYHCPEYTNTNRWCTRKVAYSVLTTDTYCCKGYVKDRGYCRKDC